MADQGASLQQAFEKLRSYLDDEVPPLLVADAMEVLLSADPKAMASGFHHWATLQRQLQKGALSVPDLLFHAIKKATRLGEFGLLPSSELAQFLKAVSTELIALCEPGEQQQLAALLAHLEDTETAMTSTLASIERPAGSGGDDQDPDAEPAEGSADEDGVEVPEVADPGESPAIDGPPDPATATDLARGLERFTAMLSRFESSQQELPETTVAASEQVQMVSQLISAAAQSAQDGDQLKRYLEQIKARGFEDLSQDNVFRTLSESVPDWAIAGEEKTLKPGAGAAETMRRIVTMDPEESLARLSQMIDVGIEHLNSGSYARAVKIFSVAEEMIAKEQVDPNMANLVRKSAGESVDIEKFREVIKKPEDHPLVSRALLFFPVMEPVNLLDRLEDEPERRQRHLLLAVLTIHGTATREVALQRMDRMLGEGLNQDSWMLLRNIVYLLRHLEPPPGAPEEQEIEQVAEISELSAELPLISEGIKYFGSIGHEKADRVLLNRLQELEQLLSERDTVSHSRDDLEDLLNMVIKSLVSCGSTRARRAVVDHACNQQSYLGDTMARLRELGNCDLSDQPEVVDRLLDLLREERSSGLLSFLRKKDDTRQLGIIRALSGTSSSAVEEAFAEIAKANPGLPVARAAVGALRRLGKQARIGDGGEEREGEEAQGEAEALGRAVKPSLVGDLGLFGLPALLQNLGQSSLSGILTLRDEPGDEAANIVLADGLVRICEVGHLDGEDACYQLLEEPFPGSFSFVDTKEKDESKFEGEGLEIMHIMMEGMRRYDELGAAKGVVPDNVRLQATGVRPTPSAEETGREFLLEVWNTVIEGATAPECQRKVKADAYRIRSLLAHWVKEGSLRLADHKP